jgi:YbbR domain-containing protein
MKYKLHVEMPTTIEVQANSVEEAREIGYQILDIVKVQVKGKKEIVDKVERFEIFDMNIDEIETFSKIS